MSATVLIVDDNPINVELLAHVVESCGHAVLTAMDGLRGQEVARKLQPSLILLDLQMPGLDGLTVVRALKRDERTRDIPVVAVTSYSLSNDRERALAAGFDDYITKPVAVDQLPSFIERWLKGSQAR